MENWFLVSFRVTYKIIITEKRLFFFFFVSLAKKSFDTLFFLLRARWGQKETRRGCEGRGLRQEQEVETRLMKKLFLKMIRERFLDGVFAPKSKKDKIPKN